ncbi:MAG: hypothetical protein WCO25_06440 [Candidatus Uhrbacteria bacterium]
MRLAVLTAHLCAAVHSPENLADAYRLRAAIDLSVRDEYEEILRVYGPFADSVAVLEEFSMTQSGGEAFLVSDELDARVLAIAGEISRLDRDVLRLRNAADVAPSSFRGLRRLRVRAMRAECLAVLGDSE